MLRYLESNNSRKLFPYPDLEGVSEEGMLFQHDELWSLEESHAWGAEVLGGCAYYQNCNSEVRREEMEVETCWLFSPLTLWSPSGTSNWSYQMEAKGKEARESTS